MYIGVIHANSLILGAIKRARRKGIGCRAGSSFCRMATHPTDIKSMTDCGIDKSSPTPTNPCAKQQTHAYQAMRRPTTQGSQRA